MVEYYREGALVGQEAPTDTRTQAELFEQNPVFPSLQPIHGLPSPERGDIGLAFSKGTRLLSGSAEVTFKGFTGEFLKELGFQEAGQNWLSDAYQSGILMGMDVNEIDAELKGPKNLGEIEDWKGAIAWGVNAVAEQVPNLVTTFAPAIIGTLILKRPTLGTVGTLGTIDFLNTAEVYTDLLMETGESRPAVAAGTGALMSSLDMIVPMRIIGRMKKGPEFASWLGKKMKDPKSGIPLKIGKAISMGATEGTTEYIQTMFEGMALNYVQEKDLLTEFSQAQQEEQLEAGARGALVGTLLGIPISYSGRSARKKAKDYTQDIIDNTQQGIVNTNEALNAQDQSNLNNRNLPVPIAGTSQGLLGEFNKAKTIEQLDLSSPQPEAAESIFEDEISQAEYMRYVRGNEVVPQRLYQIARKMSRNENLSPIEFSIYDGRRSQVESILVDIQNKDRQGKILKQSIARTKAGSIAAILNRDSVSIPELDTLSRLGTIEQARESGQQTALEERQRRQLVREQLVDETPRLTYDPKLLPAPSVPKKKEPTGIVAREKLQRKVGFPAEITDESVQAKKTKATSLGWEITGETDTVSKTGERVFKNKEKGIYDSTKIYETDKHILKKEDGLKKSFWEVTDKETGDIIDRAFGSKGLERLQIKYSSDPIDVTTARQREQEQKEIEGISLEQAMGEKGLLEVSKNDKVRWYVRDAETGKWSYPEDAVYTLIKITPKIPKGLKGKQYTVESPIYVTYELETETGKKFERTINPTEENIRLVRRLGGARKYKDFFDKPVSEVDVSLEEDLMTDTDRAELEEFTEEGEIKLKAKKLTAFYSRLETDEDFRNDVADALARAQVTRPAIEAVDKKYKKFAKRESKIQVAFPKPAENLSLLVKHDMESIEDWISDIQKVSDKELREVFVISEADFNRKVGQAQALITRRLKQRADRKVTKKRPETERDYVDLDTINPDTGERPTPDANRVKVRKSVAEEKGLESGVFYPWEDIGTVPQWNTAKGDLSNAYIKVAGQLVLKTDIINVEERTATRKIKRSDFIEIPVPEIVPNPETADKVSIDKRTGALLVKRKEDKDIQHPGLASQVDVYLTFSDRQEHEAKLEALKNALMPRARETEGKTRKIKRSVDTTKNKKFLTTDLNQSLRGGRVTAVVKPNVLLRVNKIRKYNGLPPIKDSKYPFLVSNPTTSRKNLININDGSGNIITISADSVLSATQTNVVPELIGAMQSYESLVEEGPEKGARLMASYTELGDAVSYNKFIDAVFGETAHRHGLFGGSRERIQKARTEELSKNIGERVIFEMHDGSLVIGSVTSVEGNSVAIDIPKDKTRATAKQRYNNVLIDVLNYQRVQIIKPQKIVDVGEAAPIDDIGPPDSMVVYTPEYGDAEQKQLPKVFENTASDEPTIVRVYHSRLKKTYTVSVDGVSDLQNATAQEAADYLNDVEERTAGQLKVYKLPQGLKSNEKALRVSGEGVPTEVRYTYSPGEEGVELGTTVMPVVETSEARKIGGFGRKTSSIAGKVVSRDDLVKIMSDPDAAKKLADDEETQKAAEEVVKKVTKMAKANRKKRKQQATPVVTTPDAPKDTVDKAPVTDTIADAESMRKSNDPRNSETPSVINEIPILWNLKIPTKEVSKEVSYVPFHSIPVGQKFEDKYGGQWKLVQKIGNYGAYVQFIGGKAPDLKFQVTVKGKKDVTKFSKGMTIEVDQGSTPNNMRVRISHEDFETDFENYSIVRPISADGQGSFKYNTGLTPKRFKEVLGNIVGRLNLESLIKSGEVIVVQNQQDVPFTLTNMAVHAVTRNGKTWFITNNIKESEINGLYLHEIGVHLGMKQIYGDDFNSILNEVKSRRNNPEWADAFDAATVSADQKTFADDIARENYIAEEAFAYFVESNADYKNSFWQMIFDTLKRVAARFRMYIGKPVSDGQLIAFARGAARGMAQRNGIRTIDEDDEEYYSLVQGAADRILETEGGRKLHDAAERAGYTEKAGSAWRATKKFFDPFANLNNSRLLRKLRSLLAGKMGEIESMGRSILKAYDNLTEEQNQELFEFFTTQGATFAETSTVDKQLQQASIGLKNKIEEIATEADLREMFPEASKEQLAELRGAYLPRVYLIHILSHATDVGGKFRTTGQFWSKTRKEFDESVKEMWGEIKDVKYLLYRAITMPQHDIAVIDYLAQVRVRSAIEESDALKELNVKLNQKMVDRGNATTEEEKTSIDDEVKEINKKIKEMPQEEKYVAGKVPWVMPKQFVEVPFIKKDGTEGTRKTTLARLEAQIADYQRFIQAGKSHKTIKPEAIAAAEEQVAKLEAARERFYKGLGIAVGDGTGLESYYSDNYDMKMFRPIPNKPDKYGSMAGLYVRKEIHEDIMGNADMVTGEQNLFQRMLLPYGKHAKLVSAFKTLKVPLNPPTVVRNFISNLVLMQLIGGVSFRRQPKLLRAALKEMRGEDSGMVFTNSVTGKKFTAYELAKEQGVSGTTLTSAELKKMEIVFQHMEKEGVWGILTGGQKMWNKISEFGGDLYQNIEILGKVAVIMDKLSNDAQKAELNQILSKEETDLLSIEDIAVQEANRILFDYSEVNPTVRGLRSSFLGAPFITFQVKVLPELAKVLNDPSKYHRFLPYMMLIGSAQALFGSLPFMEDDWDKLEELLPEFTKDNTMLFLPWKDSEGRWQAVDISYFFPWSWYQQMGTKLGQGDVAKAMIEGGVIGPGWQMVSTFMTGEDPWSGYKIVNENDPTSDRVFDYLSYMNSMMMPPWLTRNGLVSVSSLSEAMYRIDPTEVEGKLFDFMLGRTNRYGDTKVSFGKLVGSAIGLNPYAISPDARSAQNKRYLSEIRGFKADITSTRKNRSLSRDKKQRNVNELKRRIDETREEKAEFNRKTSGIERTL